MKLKRLFALVLCVTLAVGVLSTGALADGPAAPSPNRYADARAAAQLAALEVMVKVANARVEALVAYAQRTPYNDVPWLLRQVDRTVAPVFAYGEMIGVPVVCEYVTYYIDGQWVDIDPIRIIKQN